MWKMCSFCTRKNDIYSFEKIEDQEKGTSTVQITATRELTKTMVACCRNTFVVIIS